MNRKTQELYERIFISIKYYLTSNNNKWIKIKTATIDFEKDLQNGFNIVFPQVKIIGCLFLLNKPY